MLKFRLVGEKKKQLYLFYLGDSFIKITILCYIIYNLLEGRFSPKPQVGVVVARMEFLKKFGRTDAFAL
jgi:hypothetical protein